MTVIKFPDRRLERLAALVSDLRADPAHTVAFAYADLLTTLGKAFEAAERYCTEHKLEPSPSDYIKEYL